MRRIVRDYLVLACLVSAAAAAQGPESGRSTTIREVVVHDANNQSVLTYKKSYALVIWVGAYHNGWEKLENASDEAAEVQLLLEGQGFHVQPVGNPSGRELRVALDEFFGRYGYTADNADTRLLVYFAGHGHTRGNGRGYLVPADAPDPTESSQAEVAFLTLAMALDDLNLYARKAEAKHVLFIFDSCFAGTVFETGNLMSNRDVRIQPATARPVRQFITAGGKDEKVPTKSVFVRALIDAIADSQADSSQDGYVTATELGRYLKRVVPKYNPAQHPQFGEILDPVLNKGDFVLEGRQRRISAPGALSMWDSIRSSSDPTDFRVFLAAYPDSEQATQARKRLDQLKQEPDGSPALSQEMLQSDERLLVNVEAATSDDLSFVRLDDQALWRLCGDEDGCSIALGVTGWRRGTRRIGVPLMGPACKFFLRQLSSQRHWAVSTECSHSYGVFHRTDNEMQWTPEKPDIFTPYWSGEFGIDGVDRVGGSADDSPDDRANVLVLDTACYFSESLPRLKAGYGELLPDDTPGFFFFAASPAWGAYPDKESWPPRETGRACHLIVDD